MGTKMGQLKAYLQGIVNVSKVAYLNEIKYREQAVYKILKTPDQDNPNVYFQYTGKNITAKMPPEALMHSDFLMGFSKADIAIITRLGTKAEENLHAIKYRIANTYDDYQKTGEILVESRNGSASVRRTPSEICEDEAILSQFHPLDASIITRLHLEAQQAASSTKYTIAKQYYSESEGCFMFEIADNQSGELIAIAQHDMTNHPEMIQHLSGKDAMAIGMQYATSHHERIDRLKRKGSQHDVFH